MYSVAPKELQPLNVIHSEEALTVSRRLFPKQSLSLLSLCLLSNWWAANANMIWCVFPRAPRPPALGRGYILENFLSSVMCNIRMCRRGSRALCILTYWWCCDALHGSEELQEAHQWECNILPTDSVKRKSYDMSERPKRKGQVSPGTPHPARSWDSHRPWHWSQITHLQSRVGVRTSWLLLEGGLSENNWFGISC